jgi:hypothetical protein
MWGHGRASGRRGGAGVTLERSCVATDKGCVDGALEYSCLDLVEGSLHGHGAALGRDVFAMGEGPLNGGGAALGLGDLPHLGIGSP